MEKLVFVFEASPRESGRSFAARLEDAVLTWCEEVGEARERWLREFRQGLRFWGLH